MEEGRKGSRYLDRAAGEATDEQGVSAHASKTSSKKYKKIQPGSVTRIYSNVNLRGHVVSTNEGALSKEFLLWTDFLRYQSVIWQPMG